MHNDAWGPFMNWMATPETSRGSKGCRLSDSIFRLFRHFVTGSCHHHACYRLIYMAHICTKCVSDCITIMSFDVFVCMNITFSCSLNNTISIPLFCKLVLDKKHNPHIAAPFWPHYSHARRS
jgi:hypothetical protein